jgi:hypothetical protein
MRSYQCCTTDANNPPWFLVVALRRVSQDGRTPLRAATEQGHTAVMKSLVAAMAELEVDSRAQVHDT